ncbi:MAG: hypothetical protein LPK20_17095 [Halomonas sp.]|jgi:hypothetical protein|uniref:Uncharacterized protein n=1 Tax=Billgrantia tianxiuensis TaxID=2497861 RepID=A0A6I6SSR7_9GAMM|nr:MULTISPECIES: hypothetical protein [Halomonas]MCE8035331.1 hypothetical protein [Halomonas sp. MCCC 1A11057]MDX5435273.1 hypothetical protein [Halomonas sp.]MDX5504345.1 hypothetical protein [Halomonas sp.]QHC51866.1 hypothetical protein EKK97_22815 [Halomonas tianxiuensis]
MMYADLIDAEDFRQRLAALGIDLPTDADPDTCARLAAQRQAETGVPGLAALVAELEAQAGVMLPEVREALMNHLRPVVD